MSYFYINLFIISLVNLFILLIGMYIMSMGSSFFGIVGTVVVCYSVSYFLLLKLPFKSSK
jgi:hypothetical protein